MKELYNGNLVPDDTPTKLVNGQRHLLTQVEIDARTAEEEAYLAAKPMKEWEAKIKATDSQLPRALEDIIDALDETTKDKLAKETLDKYNEKKELRNQKPRKEN